MALPILDWLIGGKALEVAYWSGLRDGAFGAAIVLIVLYGLLGGRDRA